MSVLGSETVLRGSALPLTDEASTVLSGKQISEEDLVCTELNGAS